MSRDAHRAGDDYALKRRGGERPSSDGWIHYVPKRDLVAGLRLAFEKREIAIALELPLMSEVMRELMTMQVKVTPAGGERFEAWREGDHDDLVLAIALAWWRSARKEPPVWGGGRCRGLVRGWQAGYGRMQGRLSGLMT